MEYVTDNLLDTDLLALVWREGLFSTEGLVTTDGRSVEIRDRGERTDSPDVYSGCEVVIDGVVFRGAVLLCCGDLPALEYGGSKMSDEVVLQIVPASSGFICRSDGSFVPQLRLDCPEAVVRTYERLRTGSRENQCGYSIVTLDGFRRETLFTRLLLERFERKYNDLRTIHASTDRNWNETFYILLFRSMGAETYKNPFTRLAYAVPYVYVTRERTSLVSVEAMLLGGAGLLDGATDDEYGMKLREEFAYLSRKYDIKPLRRMVWNLDGRHRPSGTPVLRIAQLAAFLTQQEFVFSNIINCRTVDDLRRLFCAEASAYWTDHYALGRRSSKSSPKRMGEMMVDILGINLVAPLIFAYGRDTGDDNLCEVAIELLSKIPPERNTYIRRWVEAGVVPVNAFESQAMLQLSRVYCEKKLCALCPVGRPVICQSVER